MAKAIVGRGTSAPRTDLQPEPPQAVKSPDVRPPTTFLGKAPARPIDVPPEPVAAPAQIGLPDWQAKELLSQGFDPAEFPTKDLATKVLTRLTARPPAFPQQFSPPPPSVPQQVEEFDPWKGKDRKAIEAEFGEHGKQIMDVIDGLHTNYRTQLSQTHQQLAAVNGHLMQTVTAQLDGVYSALDSKYPGAFGKQSIGRLDPSSVQYSNRVRVNDLALRIMQAGIEPNLEAAAAEASQRILGSVENYTKAAPGSNDRYSQSVGFSERSLPRGETVPAKKAFMAAAREIVGSS